jgi:glutathione peroxidase
MFSLPFDMTVHDFKVKGIDGKEIALADFRGKVLLIVNVASRCAFTPQYDGLEKIHARYRDKGFTVLGFPCNQFGGQEPGSDSEIKTFCETNYKVSFPMFAKIDVNGPKADPLYQFLSAEKPGILGSTKIKWNFTKFLVDRDGHPVRRYAMGRKPDAIARDIERVLSNKIKL